ncbi:hypothetical protein KGF56_001360 [Candida oxycetoniae]|uniref:FAD-binding FR-type domain-containing protein n=1 Tax=Candida oxycetoniae TaxID=497107 RepID=A0AAI9WZ27_9ASCO|nr:uncharacterized protein KGF56_001360 [Candida oxycetoniae]KAI3405753.2 hypothetical protein KGF56_001360 [Candida oxycetoniae]
MYAPALYVAIGLLILLFPLSIQIRSKSILHNRLKKAISLCFLVSALIAIAPETAQIGAPFHKYGQSKIAFYGCNYQIQLTRAKFCNENRSFEWCYCNNFNAFSTIAHCYKTGHESQVDSLLTMCQQYNKTIGLDIYRKATLYYDTHARSIENTANTSSLITFPVKLNETETHIFERAYQNFLGNFDLSVNYGAYLVLYWVAVFFLAALGNWSKILFPGLQKRLTDPLTNWFRKRISLPATGKKNKANHHSFCNCLDMLVPTRAETLIILTSGVLCGYFFTANISYVEGDPLFHTKTLALLRYYAVRASILASSMMPLLLLFGGRNNFLQWLTRWDYSTFIALHRWVSRLVVVLILIHSANYSFYLRLNKSIVHSCFWQSHPFTYISTENELVMFIKVKKGVTLALAEYLKTHKDRYTQIRVAVEGSYGETTPAGKYDSAVFIAGGSGSAGIYSEALDLTKTESQRKVKFIWIIREYKSLFWFYKELIALKDTKIESTVYITRPSIPIEREDFESRMGVSEFLDECNELTPAAKQTQKYIKSNSQFCQDEFLDECNELTPLITAAKQTQKYIKSNSLFCDDFLEKIKSELRHVTFIEGKPDIEKLVQTNIEESKGSTSFVTCGHPAMVDDIRASVVNNIANDGKKRVDYFEQLQVWA